MTTTPTPTTAPGRLADETTLTLATRRVAGEVSGEPGAAARALMRGTATAEDRLAHLTDALVAAGLVEGAFSPVAPRAGLTPHQGAVAAALREGMSTTEAGQALGIAHATVKNHVGNLTRRWGVSTRVELLVELVRAGFFPGAPAVGDATPDATPARARCGAEGCATRTTLRHASGLPACGRHGGVR